MATKQKGEVEKDMLFFYFFLSCLKFEHLINGNKNLTSCKLQNPTLAVAIGHLSLLSWIQSTYSTKSIFTGRAVMRVDTYLEDRPQFAHDLYHLHIIIMSIC